MIKKLTSGLALLVGVPILAGAVGLFNSESQGSLAPPIYENFGLKRENNKNKPVQESQIRLPYVIPGTNRLDPIHAKKFECPEKGYIVKPHPYKEKSFLILRDPDYRPMPKIDNDGWMPAKE